MLLVISPDFASHYAPMAVLAGAARRQGRRVVVATGPALRLRVEADGFEWRSLVLGARSNAGVVTDSPAIARFVAATRAGAIDTIRHQALERELDLLWRPEQVAHEIADLLADLEPDDVLVDHVSFASTLALHASGRPFVTLVPGHPSQLPVGAERYGIPSVWPTCLDRDPGELADLALIVDRVTAAFTDRWNRGLAAVAPGREPVEDAFRVHGRTVLYNSVSAHHLPSRSALLPNDHRFVGPLVRDEALPDDLVRWRDPVDDRPQVYVALGTFLSLRADVLARIVDALRLVGARAAVAIGSTPRGELGELPDDWTAAPQLPQVALMRCADLAIHHGGNNSVQESLAAGVRQIVLPFSTDQFANAADLERLDAAAVLSPNEMTVASLADAIADRLATPSLAPVPTSTPRELADALLDCRVR